MIDTQIDVVIEDIQTDTVTSIQELPDHLKEWTFADIAQWAVDNDDVVAGRQAVPDETMETDVFGKYNASFTMYFRAGGRYLVSVTYIESVNGQVW